MGLKLRQGMSKEDVTNYRNAMYEEFKSESPEEFIQRMWGEFDELKPSVDIPTRDKTRETHTHADGQQRVTSKETYKISVASKDGKDKDGVLNIVYVRYAGMTVQLTGKKV